MSSVGLRFGHAAGFPVLIALATFSCVHAAYGQVSISGASGSSVSLAASGVFTVSLPEEGWSLSGALGAVPRNGLVTTGTDMLGAWQELDFDYELGPGNRSAAIRGYSSRPLFLFSVTYNDAAPNSAPFPAFTAYPQLQRLTFSGEFASPSFSGADPDSPWIYFDADADTFIVSPASDFMVAATTLGSGNQIQAGISTGIKTLPAGLTHRTMLVFGRGINRTMTVWGQALTDLSGKQRPANDADALSKKLSYWTDNGATYYYNAGGSSYSATLQAVKAEFDSKNIALGSMQLDSWWYPKGPDSAWTSGGGIWNYSAALGLFQPDLPSFQAALGVPLVTHARWIDAGSPYRTRYQISGNVATDPQYWEDTAAYLLASGVTTYEQDWLGDNAHADFNLTDPAAFLGNMAASMAKRGITMQYCMADPAHFLQSTLYSNLTTIRSAGDRFGQTRWEPFLYSSAFAGALGIWPFSDVFMSTERDNLLLATLSAGPVGIGDPLGNISRENLLRSVRPDGIIVKPDFPAMPLDSVFIADAQGIDVPMVASTYSDFGGLRANYIFAWVRGANTLITIQPASFGITGAAWLYDDLNNTGHLIDANASLALNLTAGGANYFVLMPVGSTGIAFLGDKGQFVTMGKKRIAALADNGYLYTTVSFAAGETTRTLFGYSPQPVTVTAIRGRAEIPAWDPTTQMFTVDVHPSGTGVAELRMTQSSASSATPIRCIARCGTGSGLSR